MAGVYLLTVTDANGCTAAAAPVVHDIGGPSVFIIPLHVSCYGGNNGRGESQPSGGTPPYTYRWNTGGTNQNLVFLQAGNYTLTVTDLNNCIAVGTVTITEPPVLNASLNTVVASCNNQDGEIGVTVSGGVPPYSYVWDNGCTDAVCTGLSTGTYSVTVTDAEGCNSSQNDTISNLPGPTVVLTVQDASCFGVNDGKIFSSVSLGTPPYIYDWNTPGTNSQITHIHGGEIYRLKVRDADSCLTIRPWTYVGEPDSLSLNTVSIPSFCNRNNGLASASAVGGTPPYSYQWLSGQTTASIDSLAAGTYSVVTLDANGCTDSVTITVIDSSYSPPQPIISPPGTIYFCDRDSMQLSSDYPSGNLWSNGAQTDTISVNSGGSFYVQFTDQNGCSSVSDTILVIVQENPDTPAILVSGNILYTLAGGSYEWSYNGSLIPGANDSAIIVQESGTYQLTITDVNGCSTPSLPIAHSGNVGLNVEQVPHVVGIYPNPNNGTFYIVYDEANQQIHEIHVYAANGDEIGNFDLTKTLRNKYLINMPYLSPGLYFIKIVENGNTLHRKMMLVK